MALSAIPPWKTMQGTILATDAHPSQSKFHVSVTCFECYPCVLPRDPVAAFKLLGTDTPAVFFEPTSFTLVLFFVSLCVHKPWDLPHTAAPLSHLSLKL